MTECQYHQELDKRLRDCEVIKVVSAEHEKKIDLLFTYHDEMEELIRKTEKTLSGLQNAQHSWAGSLSGQLQTIKEMLEIHIDSYKKFVSEASPSLEEVKNFQWFRSKMNWLKECLPWWFLSLIMILIISLFVSFEGLRKLLQFLRWSS